jgi:hypothetical protein
LGKLYNGTIVTDICDRAWKQRCLLALEVKNAAQNWERSILEIDCWHNIHNIWFGHVTKNEQNSSGGT